MDDAAKMREARSKLLERVVELTKDPAQSFDMEEVNDLLKTVERIDQLLTNR